MSGPIYGYYVNLDERGSFYADVRDAGGKTVFEVRAGNELDDDVSSLVDDGFMRDLRDTQGLTDYLRSMSVIPADAQVLPSRDFEERLEAAQAEADAEGAVYDEYAAAQERVVVKKDRSPEAVERLYTTRDAYIDVLAQQDAISQDDIRRLERTGRVIVASSHYNLCDTQARNALLADEHHQVRACAEIARYQAGGDINLNASDEAKSAYDDRLIETAKPNYPEDWNGVIEVEACVRDEDNRGVERAQGRPAEFYGIYARHEDGLAVHLLDTYSEQAAQTIAARWREHWPAFEAKRGADAQVEASDEDRRIFTVSVTFEKVTAESAEHGDADERGYEVEDQDVDYDDLRRMARERNYSEPSSSVMTSPMWFTTPDAEESREYFEDGVSTYYSLHLKAVDGNAPTLEDYAELAQMLGARVSDLERHRRSQPDGDEPSPSV